MPRELVAQGTVASFAVGCGMGPFPWPCLRPHGRELASCGAAHTQGPGKMWALTFLQGKAWPCL